MDQVNDLWQYNLALGQWAYMKGSMVHNQFGVYGPEGSFGTSYKPGARYGAVSWTGKQGDLWLFGGYGFGTSWPPNYKNDLWKYDINLGQWAYMKGSPGLSEQPDVYGARGEFDPAYRPGGRNAAVPWTDKQGNLWLFGGLKDIPMDNVMKNVLWKYDINLGQWAYIKGAPELSDLPAVYGAQGEFNATYDPGARSGALSWVDTEGDFWLFGGSGNSGNNDLWKYDAPGVPPQPSAAMDWELFD